MIKMHMQLQSRLDLTNFFVSTKSFVKSSHLLNRVLLISTKVEVKLVKVPFFGKNSLTMIIHCHTTERTYILSVGFGLRKYIFFDEKLQ